MTKRVYKIAIYHYCGHEIATAIYWRRHCNHNIHLIISISLWMQNVTIATSPPAPVESVDTNPTSGDRWRGVRTSTIICKFNCVRFATPYDQNVPTTDSLRSRPRYLHQAVGIRVYVCVCACLYTCGMCEYLYWAISLNCFSSPL